MSAAAYKAFESERENIAIILSSNQDWMRSKNRREQTNFIPKMVIGHSAEKARVLDKREFFSNLQEKLGYLQRFDAPKLYPRDAATRDLFFRLSDAWRQETIFESSISKIVMNENYQKIIGLGPKAVPWIIDDLKNSEDHWFWALRMITRENPVSEDIRGRIPEMVRAWVEWAKDNGIE